MAKIKNNLNDNFWKWFGNSKMIRHDGKPIKFYHTTDQDFNTFEPVSWDNNEAHIDYENGHQQYYFAKNIHWSKRFGQEELKRNGKRKTIIVYLKVENPIIIRHNVVWSIDKWINFFENKGISLDKEELIKTSNRYGYSNEDWKKIIDKQSFIFWELIHKDKKYFKNCLENAGYDGVIFRDTYRGDYPRLSVVVFSNNQIKSVDNNGEWSTESSNIYENKN